MAAQYDVPTDAKWIFSSPQRISDVSSRKRVSSNLQSSTLTCPSSLSETTSQPSPVTANRVADIGDSSSFVKISGACTSKRIGSCEGSFSTSAPRMGSGTSSTESNLVAK